MRRTFLEQQAYGIAPEAIELVIAYEYLANKSNRKSDYTSEFGPDNLRGRGLGWGAMHDQTVAYQFGGSHDELNRLRTDLDSAIPAIAEILSVGATRYLDTSGGRLDIRNDAVMLAYGYNVGVYSSDFNRSLNRVAEHYRDFPNNAYTFDISGNHPAAKWVNKVLPNYKSYRPINTRRNYNIRLGGPET